MNFLNQVVKAKKLEVKIARREMSLRQMAVLAARAKKTMRRRNFAAAISGKSLSLIAEIKLKSPSAGRLARQSFLHLARTYAKSKASAISVLTDKNYFGGRLEHLLLARQTCPQPILRKDFIIDEYQIYQSRAFGADAVLLIAAILNPAQLKRLLALAGRLGLDCLVEAHDQADLKKALKAGAKIIGINNRDLKSLKINLQTTAKLIKLIPKNKIVVSESGINKTADAVSMRAAGANAILAGSAIAAAKNPAAKIKELTSASIK